MPSPYQGMKLKLHSGWIFVQLDNPGDPAANVRSVVVNINPPFDRYTPQNESARMVLDLLTLNAHKNKGTTFEDIKGQLVLTFQVTVDQADADLTAFLNDLQSFNLLDKPEGSDKVDPIPYPLHQGDNETRGHIQHGGTLVSTSYGGYAVVPYRP